MECLPQVNQALVDTGVDTLDLEGCSVYEEHPKTYSTSTVYVGHQMTGILSKCKVAKPQIAKTRATKRPNLFEIKNKSDPMTKLKPKGDNCARYSIDESNMLSPEPQPFMARQYSKVVSPEPKARIVRQ